MKKIASIILVLVMLFNCMGCATSQLTPLQKRILESKELEGTFDNAFGATVSVLQDKGYMIESSDRSAGLLYAELHTYVRARPAIGWILCYVIPYFILQMGKRNYVYKATINLEKITDSRVKMRLSFSGLFDNRMIEPVQDVQFYQDFYADIQKEMFRRTQLNK